MNKENSDIINKFLLIGDKFMSEIHLWDPKVKKYFVCGPFTKHTQRINQFMKDKYKGLKNRTQSDVAFKNKAYKIAVDPKYNGYERALASMVWKFFNEKSKK